MYFFKLKFLWFFQLNGEHGDGEGDESGGEDGCSVLAVQTAHDNAGPGAGTQSLTRAGPGGCYINIVILSRE